ncbi:hypothetical protein AAFC00_006022 [Neodothiora populina]|uniref:Zn(2)-C6 fungal-type domain-containing protein n=1 Tax=Neodothiora populina TaxID=2781224 RepID=A0ABR3P703_9PEZI
MPRQLLPAITPHMQVPRPSVYPRPRRRAIKNTSVACNRCRQFKSKCDGANPCQSCRAKNFDICIYETENSRTALKERNETLRKQLAAYRGPESTSSETSSNTPPNLTTSSLSRTASPDAHHFYDECAASGELVFETFDRDEAVFGQECNSEVNTPQPRHLVAELVMFLETIAVSTTDDNTRCAIFEYINRHRAGFPAPALLNTNHTPNHAQYFPPQPLTPTYPVEAPLQTLLPYSAYKAVTGFTSAGDDTALYPTASYLDVASNQQLIPFDPAPSVPFTQAGDGGGGGDVVNVFAADVLAQVFPADQNIMYTYSELP